MGKRIAIIGSGISGLSVAYHLHQKYAITVYEKNGALGGHTDTHSLNIDGKVHQVDSGFIVFCQRHYPHFCRMLDALGVDSQATDMSFSAHNERSGVVYNATSLNRLFCQRKNLFSGRFYRMIFDIVRFYRHAPKLLKEDDHQTTVKQYLQQRKYSSAFMDDHLFPMIGALWSATPERVAQFPIRHLVDFLHKHGMMNLLFRPPWRVIKNGSSSYIDALRSQIDCNWLLANPVIQVQRSEHGVTVVSEQGEHHYDAVVFATHADQALTLLEHPSDDEQAILSAMQFERNQVVIHGDESVLHPNRLAWASWNTQVSEQTCCTATYWMNLLQGLNTKMNVFVSLNSRQRIDPDRIFKERVYYHPVFTADSVAAQKKQHLINGQQNTFYVGAYWGWGFHEDGARSAYETARLIEGSV